MDKRTQTLEKMKLNKEIVQLKKDLSRTIKEKEDLKGVNKAQAKIIQYYHTCETKITKLI